jgi:hypothetical protein
LYCKRGFALFARGRLMLISEKGVCSFHWTTSSCRPSMTVCLWLRHSTLFPFSMVPGKNFLLLKCAPFQSGNEPR